MPRRKKIIKKELVRALILLSGSFDLYKGTVSGVRYEPQPVRFCLPLRKAEGIEVIVAETEDFQFQNVLPHSSYTPDLAPSDFLAVFQEEGRSGGCTVCV